MNRLPPISPGELLQEEFLEPLGISQYRLAKSIGVPASRISEIIAGQRAITADTDLRLCVCVCVCVCLCFVACLEQLAVRHVRLGLPSVALRMLRTQK